MLQDNERQHLESPLFVVKRVMEAAFERALPNKLCPHDHGVSKVSRGRSRLDMNQMTANQASHFTRTPL